MVRLACVAVLGLAASLLSQSALRLRIPVHLVENRGLYAGDVAFFAQGVDRTVFFRPGGVDVVLFGSGQVARLRVRFPGGRLVRPMGLAPRAGRVSYFRGRPEEWRTGLKTYGGVLYRGLWPGVDLEYRGGVNVIKYTFRLAAGVDPRGIRLQIEGAEALEVTEAGGLRMRTAAGVVEDAPPVAYQENGSERVPVAVRYRLDPAQSEVGFVVGQYDPRLPLILDPVVFVYCRYIGGASADYIEDVALDAYGNLYVAGWTFSPPSSFPVVNGPFTRYSGWFDAFVARVSPDGTRLDYCGYIEGKDGDAALGVAVDPSLSAYVVGYSRSDEKSFPVRVGPFLKIANALTVDAFVAKVSPDGQSLVYCGYIGGLQHDAATSVAVDRRGAAYVGGWTRSTEKSFPVKVGPDLTFSGVAGYWEGFVAKVTPDGRQLAWCGYIGGRRQDTPTGIAVDANGTNVYVGGRTQSPETEGFPVTGGPDLTFNDPPYGVGLDGWVARLRTTWLTALGVARPGEKVGLVLWGEPNLPYRMGTSLGPGPTVVGRWRVPLRADSVFFLSAGGLLPGVFRGYQGRLDGRGLAGAELACRRCPRLWARPWTRPS